MSVDTPIKAISVGELERALEEFEAAPGSGKSHFVAFVAGRARTFDETDRDAPETFVFLDPSAGSDGMLQLLTVFISHAADDHVRFARLVELLMPDDAVPDSAVVGRRAVMLKPVPPSCAKFRLLQVRNWPSIPGRGRATGQLSPAAGARRVVCSRSRSLGSCAFRSSSSTVRGSRSRSSPRSCAPLNKTACPDGSSHSGSLAPASASTGSGHSTCSTPSPIEC